MHAHITVTVPVERTPRVQQVEGMFDLTPAHEAARAWEVILPIEDKVWNLGLIVGPSGSGKSTVARRLFASPLERQDALPDWPTDRALLDGFPAGMPIKDIVALLSAVGFSSPPAWLRPFRVLSTGEQFRANLARLLASANGNEAIVVDEYTSVVDRTVARVGSAAVAGTVRARNLRFVAVTCHDDVEDWLQPDWVYRPATNTFAWRLLQRRPAIELDVARVDHSAWPLFCPHHYLSGELARSAVCFMACWESRPVAFSAWIRAMSKRGGRREHRTVTLPDYQGVGIGHRLSGFCASLWKALGERAASTTTHPAFVAARLKSRDWRLVRSPTLGRADRRLPRLRHATTRLTAGFEYVGPPLDAWLARRLLGDRR
jgi:GNAT superfamily N-acetyltransferase